MSNRADQKIRLLALYELLQSKTDETHSITTQEIIERLAERGITVGRQTLYNDIAVLNEYGYEVIQERSRSNEYYVVSRKFELPEVQVLLSAVGGAQFLSTTKTENLIQKLLELLGISEAKNLQELLQSNRNKHNNERIYYTIDTLVTAFTQKKKVSFLYFDYGLNGKREYRKDKRRYYVNPLGFAYSDDKLYLVCYHDKFDTPTNYRIDRMDEVQVDKHGITEKSEFENFDMNRYRQEQFDMYGGESEEVELVFPQDLLEIAIDRFGEDISTTLNEQDEYIVKVSVQVSKTFFAWLTTFEGRVGINSPAKIKEQYKDFIKTIEKSL